MEFGRLKNFIDGEWKDSQSDDIWEIRNPALDEVIGEVPMSLEEEVAEAVRSAKDAFPEWRRTPPVSRARYILRLVELMDQCAQFATDNMDVVRCSNPDSHTVARDAVDHQTDVVADDDLLTDFAAEH